MADVQSCDTFVVLGDKTVEGNLIFGKNSDRPNGEVQEVVYFPAGKHPSGTKLSVSPGRLEHQLSLEISHGFLFSSKFPVHFHQH
jgi:hypothetical protein